MARKESDFQTDLCHSVAFFEKQNPLHPNIFYKKFADDTLHSMGYDCELRFYNKNLFALELKCYKDTISTLNFKTMFSKGREHEIETLKKQISFGFKSYVLVNHFIFKKKINDIYLFSADYADELFKKGSIKISELDYKRCTKFGWEKCPTTKNKIFDLSYILNSTL